MNDRAAGPRFDVPTYTVPVRDRFPDSLPGVPRQDPLPPLVDPEPEPVTTPSSEPLIRVEHQRIRTLQNYWHGAWTHAVPGTWLRRSVFDALGSVADGLPERWGLAVFDAWRPIALQEELFAAAYDEPGAVEPGFISPVSHDPATPPPHLSGGTVDVGLSYDGWPLAPGAGFDDLTPRAGAAFFENDPGPERELRRWLYWLMRAEGFVVLDCEWWHFELGTRRWAAITGNEARYGAASPPV